MSRSHEMTDAEFEDAELDDDELDDDQIQIDPTGFEDDQFGIVTEIISRWYGRFFNARVGSPAFYSFAARGFSLSKQVAPSIKETLIESGMMAYSVPPSKIVIPTSYFMPEFYMDFGVPFWAESHSALACINGSQIHEGFHCLWTPGPTYVEFMAGDVKATQYLKEDGRLFGLCANIVEDVFIENKGSIQFKNLFPFVTAKNFVLFNDSVIDDAYEAACGEEATIEDLARLLGTLKRGDLWEDPMLAPWTKAVDIIKDAKHIDLKVPDRVMIMIRLYEYLKSDEPKKPDGEDFKESKGDGEDNSEGGFGGGDSVEEKLAELLEALGKMLNAKKWDGKSAESIAKEGEIKQGIKEAQENQTPERIIKTIETSGTVPPMYARDVMEIPVRGGMLPLMPMPQFRGMGNHLRMMREVKHTPGQPRQSGNVLLGNRLAHIAIDQNVLAYCDAKNVKRGKPEVIILIDLSGSMGWSDLYRQVISGAYEAFNSLRQARVPVAVYAHTSSTTDKYNDVPAIYGIAAYEMPFLDRTTLVNHGDFRRRFEQAMRVSREENYDGHAVKYCLQRFSPSNGSKFLVVMSDGLPSGQHGYGGKKGIEHTHNVAKLARKNGISVVSFSLVEHVVESNNEIYGEEYNVKAYGTHFLPELQKMVYKLALIR